MASVHIFISHASKDDDFVKELRTALEGHQLPVWVDSRNLRGGDKLAPEIEQAIETARHVIVALSPNTINSPWVRLEIQQALAVEKRRGKDGYRVIPLLLPGVEPSALALWFDEEPVGVKIELKVSGVSEALPQILAALGERLPEDHEKARDTDSAPVAELILKLSDAKIETFDGKTRARATATLVYEPADGSRNIESQRYYFTAPLGLIEADDLRWYLEEYFRWPAGLFKERAARIEARLPQWGQDLFKAALDDDVARDGLFAWRQAAGASDRRFSVMIERELPKGASQEDQAAADAAASALLSLPWELLHDGRGFLFHGQNPVRVRRRLPNRHQQKPAITNLPIRILLVSPRPEDERAGYIDHRISALPLVEAVEDLGELAELTILSPPTFAAMEEALVEAAKARKPFDVIHFDGHGVYDREHGLGALCFEDPKDSGKLEKRAMQLIHAEKLAAVIRERRIPLVFLEACQTARIEDDPTASVAAKLLEEGVTSVVAMSHSVLVETARRFVTAFYRELARGARVGRAMLAGQQSLHNDDYRGRIMGAGELRLQDWFVPVLFQEEQDLQIVTKAQSQTVRELEQRRRRLSLGDLLEEKERMGHDFVGRSRELLTLERMLANQHQRYAVVRGQGGVGKTTLAVELAHWLARTERFERAAFVSLEQYTDARGVLIRLGQQLLPDGDKFHIAATDDLREGRLRVERALRDHATIIVLDNLESVLSSTKPHEEARREEENLGETSCDLVDEIFTLCRDLLDADPATRLIFTSREPLPEPFDHRHRVFEIPRLSREDAIELVSEVMKREGLEPKHDDAGDTPEEIVELVKAVNRHARALTLLAREIARHSDGTGGVRATTGNLRQLMADLDHRHPGDRENSLYASVELSLRRLPPEVREQIKVLGVFHDGANLAVLRMMLGAEWETVGNIAARLIEVGLAELPHKMHLRLDPALPPYLLREMSEAEQEEARTRWAEAMWQLTAFLYEQFFQDAELFARLTLLELPNLMSMLRWSGEKASPEEVVDLANSLETLLSRLGRPQALAQATRAREQAAQRLGEWSHASFTAEGAKIDRLLERGDLQSAYEAAQQLLDRSLAAGEEAFPEAKYFIAMAHFSLGRALRNGGTAEAALSPLAEAQRRFQALTDAGDADAAGMASAAITESADCLTALGRWDEAAAAYQEAIGRAEKLGRRRDLAVDKLQLGTVRMLQQRYAEALEIYAEAREIFESLGEPGSVATIWHQIGMVHKDAEQFEQAERAYRQSLAIRVQHKLVADEADSLLELGNLYCVKGQLEDSVKCYRQAVDIYVRLQDQSDEGLARNNLANTLIELQRYDEARRELLRAIECKKPYSHAAGLWMTWNNLCNLERATGNPQAADEARRQAIASFLAYRRDGGQSMDWGAQACAAVAQAIQTNEPDATTGLEEELAEFLTQTDHSRAHALIPKLQALLRGDRAPALAADPVLTYVDAVELQLLLEALGAK
ncbi:MAG: tetratricopeptide repeat protein [Blastocatellia bacterium]